MKKTIFFSTILLCQNAFATETLFEELTNNSSTMKLGCALQNVGYKGGCVVSASYLGSTMGHDFKIKFPNGKAANYRVITYGDGNPGDYEGAGKITMQGWGDKHGKYEVISNNEFLLSIFRNDKPWVLLWKKALQGKHVVKNLSYNGSETVSVTTNKRNFNFYFDMSEKTIQNMKWSQKHKKPVCIVNFHEDAYVFKKC